MHKYEFPAFDLGRLLQTVFSPQKGEKLAILVDLKDPTDVINFEFLKNDQYPVQKRAYHYFYEKLQHGVMQQLALSECDFFAYKTTGGSNLDLPDEAVSSDGEHVNMEKDIYSVYDIVLCITDYSATAPLTALAKKFGFRGTTMHGLNEIILQSGLAVDYTQVSAEAERLRLLLTRADSIEIDFETEGKKIHLFVDLGKQEAQKSHGLCPKGPDIVNLPAGEVYFVPQDAKGAFPYKMGDGSLCVMHVDHGRVHTAAFLKGNQKTVEELQLKLDSDPAAGVLGEIGFGTQVLPFSNADIQDEKIFGTFHLATGRNDHLDGDVTVDRFVKKENATHDDILFSSTKTPEIRVHQVRMKREGKVEILIENYEPSPYLAQGSSSSLSCEFAN